MVDGKMIKILYEDNHLLIIEKPVNVPVQEDESHDLDLLTILKKYLKEKYQKPGNVYLGLVHRLDRPVGGVMVLAKTSKCASRLSEQIRNKTFQKEYYAILDGDIKPSEGVLEDYLVKDAKTNMVSVNSLGKYAKLRYKKKKVVDNLSLIHIFLETGRSHQIRVQFASRGYPLYGDMRYNQKAKVGMQIALWATKITFAHPITKEIISFSCPYPKVSPWNKF